MAEGKLPFAEGASINMSPSFSGVIESFDRGVGNTISNGLYVLKTMFDGQIVNNPWSEWSDFESKKAQFDSMAKNIITLALNLDEFFRVSQSFLPKKM